jgi:membrane associated rhomboid family serine protease
MSPVSNYFSRIAGRGSDDPWFRFKELDVTTTTLICGLSFITMFVYAISKTFFFRFALIPDDILGGQIWRIVSWPVFQDPDPWAAISILFLWMFGNQVESLFGTKRFLLFLAYVLVPSTIIGTLFGMLPYWGPGLVIVVALIAFASEFRGAQFFFGIPARIMVAILVAVQFLTFMSKRGWADGVFFFTVVALTLVALRGFGFGEDLAKYIPAFDLPGSRVGPKKAKKARGKGKLKAVPNPPSSGGWAAPGSATSQSPEVQADVDRLLDKIASQGLGSLSKEERKRLDAASKQLRKDQ